MFQYFLTTNIQKLCIWFIPSSGEKWPNKAYSCLFVMLLSFKILSYHQLFLNFPSCFIYAFRNCLCLWLLTLHGLLWSCSNLHLTFLTWQKFYSFLEKKDWIIQKKDCICHWQKKWLYLYLIAYGSAYLFIDVLY